MYIQKLRSLAIYYEFSFDSKPRLFIIPYSFR